MAPRLELPIRTPVVAAILRRIAEAGSDANAVREELGLDPAAATEPESVLPLTSLERLYVRGAELCHDDNFGLHLAVNFPRGTYGLVEFIARNSPTIREGFARIVQYARIMNDRVKVSFTERAGTGRLEHSIPGRPLSYGRHGNEFFVPAVLFQAQLLAGQPLPPTRIWFAHPAPADLSRHHELLGRRVEFDAGSNGFELPSALLDLPIHSADGPLFTTLELQAQKQLPPPSESVGERVSEELRHRLAQTPTLQSVARGLRCSARTLQSRLEGEGASFNALLDGVRAQEGKALVREGQVGLAEVSFRLGYSELPAFLRAFKRWTGKTPSAWRKR